MIHSGLEIPAGLLCPVLFLECVVEYSYRDCLKEEIEILRLKLYRDEFSYASSSKYNLSLLDKIERNLAELADLDRQAAA